MNDFIHEYAAHSFWLGVIAFVVGAGVYALGGRSLLRANALLDEARDHLRRAQFIREMNRAAQLPETLPAEMDGVELRIDTSENLKDYVERIIEQRQQFAEVTKRQR